MELQYHSTSLGPISWPSLRIQSRSRPHDAIQGYQEWQGQEISGFFDHTEDPTYRGSTGGLAGDSLSFSESEALRTSRLNHIITSKSNRSHAQYTGQDSLYQDRVCWDTRQSLSRQNENRFTASPSFVAQTNELSLNNCYKNPRRPMDSEPCPPRKKYRGSAVTAERNENTTSAFKVFKRNDNNKFSRIKERNKNLPPPPPLVKANGKINKISKPEAKSREEIIVICDSPPPQARLEKVQSDFREDSLRSSKLETISRETLHHSKPISSTRVHAGTHSMNYRQTRIAPGNYQPRGREYMEHAKNSHCHHYDNVAYVSKGLSQFSNSRNDMICTGKSTPFVTTQNTRRSHYEPHTGIQCHTDYHNGNSYSPSKKTSGTHMNGRSMSHKVLDSPSPSRNASGRTFCDDPEALHAWRLKSQLTVSSSNLHQMNSPFAADVLRHNARKASSNLLDTRSSCTQEVSAFREPRHLKDHRAQTPLVVVRSHNNNDRTEHATIHKKSEYSCQTSKESPFKFINQKMSQLSKKDQERLSKLLEMHCHGRTKNARHPFIITQQPSRVPEIYEYHNIQKLPISECSGEVKAPSVTQKLTHAQRQETLRSLLLHSKLQSEKSFSVPMNTTRGEVTLPSGLTDSALISHHKPHLSQMPVPSSPTKGYFLFSSGNVETRGNPAVISQVTCPNRLFDSDRLPISNEKGSQEKKNLVIASKSNASRSPTRLDSNRKSHQETPVHQTEATSSQPISRMSTSTDADQNDSPAQRNPVALFRSPPQSRRLSYPLENNRSEKDDRSQENSSATLQRSKSEGDQQTPCGTTEASSLLENFSEDKTAANACGGYAFDHDSLPIIVAVHSVVVKNDSPQGIESSQEAKPKDSEVVSSHRVVDALAVAKNEPTRYQRPILPKPAMMNEKTAKLLPKEMQVSGELKSEPSYNQRPILPKPDAMTEKTKPPGEMQVSGDQYVIELLAQSSRSSPLSSSIAPPPLPPPPPSSSSSSSMSSSSSPCSSTTLILASLLSSSSSSPLSIVPSSLIPSSTSSSSAAAAAAAIKKPVNSVSVTSSIATHSNDDKQRSQAKRSVSTDNLSSNDVNSKENVGQAIQVDNTTDTVTDVSSEITANGSASHLPNKSADEVCEGKAKTSKLIVHRRHSVEELSNKIVETRERIDKEEIDWKKKLLRRLEFVLIKKLKKAEKETGEKASIDLPPDKNIKSKEEHKKAKTCKRNRSCSDEPCSKEDQEDKDEKDANKERKKHRSKADSDITESGDCNVDEKSQSKMTGKSVDSVTQEQTHAGVAEETPSNKDTILVSSFNGIITVGHNSLLSSPSPAAAENDDFADICCSDLVIAE